MKLEVMYFLYWHSKSISALQRSITGTSVFRLLSVIFNFLIVILLSRVLGPMVKGDATLIITIITFLVFFCSVVGGQALVYMVPRYRIERLVIPAYIWTILVASVAYILMRQYSPFTWRRTFNICLLSLLGSIGNIHGAVLLAKQEIRKYNIITVLPHAITLVGLLVALFVWDMNDIYAYLYPLYIGYLLTAILSFYLCRQFIQPESLDGVFDDIDSSLKNGVGYQLFDLLQLLNFRLYFFLLYHIQGAADLGVFSVGVSILEVAWIVGRSTATIQYSGFSNLKSEEGKIASVIQNLKAVFFVSAVILLIAALCPDQIYAWVFGSAFGGVKGKVKWLFPGVLVYNLTLVIQGVYLSRGSYGRLIFAQLSGLVCAIALCYLLIPRYFFSGASGSASVGFGVISVIVLLFFMADYKVTFAQLIPNKGDLLFIQRKLRKLLHPPRLKS